MGEDGKGCIKNAAIGCGVALLVGVGIVALMAASVIAPLKRASAARVQLDAGFETQESFTPGASGAIAAERVERFIAVRRDLQASCEGFARAEQEFRRIEAFDDQEDVNRLEVMTQAFKTTRAAMGIGPLMGEHFELRNRSLLEHGMGLGELSYLYVMAYQRQLAQPRPGGGIFDDEPVNERLRAALRSMLQRQRSAAAAGDLDAAWMQALDEEIALFEEDPARVPWQDGLPQTIEASLAEYREALDALYCDAAAPMELLLNRRRAMAYETY